MSQDECALNMNRETQSGDVAPAENLLVLENNGQISSRRVSKVYGKALLGAMATRTRSTPATDLHISFLPQHESWTVENIRNAVQAVAPADNFLFIDDSRKILSCRISPEYGAALLENLPEEASQTQSVLSQRMDTQTGAITSNRGMVPEASQHPSGELHHPDSNASSSPSSMFGTPDNNLGILSDDILSSANRQPYDRDWMGKYGINEECLDGSTSKHKLDMLVRHGAVKVGDKLRVTYYQDGGPVIKIGEVLQSFKSGRLDLRIAPTGRDSDGILYDCKGPKDILSGMDKEFGMRHHARASEAWKVVDVVSVDGREIGSLWKMRLAYQVFSEQMKEWGVRNRQNSP